MHAFLPALRGPSPSYHDSLASQSPRHMRGRGVTAISALVNCGFSRSEAQCFDRKRFYLALTRLGQVSNHVAKLLEVLSKRGSNDREKH